MRTEQITRTWYKFEELPEDDQQKIMDDMLLRSDLAQREMEYVQDRDFWSDLEKQFHLGVQVDQHIYYDVARYVDVVAYHREDFYEHVLSLYARKFTDDERKFINQLIDADVLSFSIDRRHKYSCSGVRVECALRYMSELTEFEDNYDEAVDMADKFLSVVEEYAEDFLEEARLAIRRLYEYATSEEYIRDCCINLDSEYTYDDQGRLVL
jgi:hypothetical protein